MARRGRINYTPEEVEILRNAVVRQGDVSYVPQEVYQQIRENRQNQRAAERGITQDQLLALRAERRANQQESRLGRKAARQERRQMRRERSPEDFEIFRQNRLNERAAQQGITVDQLLENREQRRQDNAARRQNRLDDYNRFLDSLLASKNA